MRLSVVRKKSVIIGVCYLVLVILMPLAVTLITKSMRYSTFVLKLLEVIFLISSLIYTYNVFNNQIKRNVMFGITRKETYKKWAVKTGIIGLGIILSGALNTVIANVFVLRILPAGEALIGSLLFFEGFYCYFGLNFLVFYVISNNNEDRKIKRRVLFIFIIGVLVSIFLCFLVFYFLSDLPNVLQTILFYLYVSDMIAGPVIALIGFILIYFIEKIHIKGILYKGEY